MKKILTALIFLSQFCNAQVVVNIINPEIDSTAGLTIFYENDSSLFKSEMLSGKNFKVDTTKFRKITISHIGYKDTTVLLKNLLPFNNVLLVIDYKELQTVSVQKLQKYNQTDLQTKKGKRLFFRLSSNNTWYFTPELPKGLRKIENLVLKFKNLTANDVVNFKLYANEVFVLKEEPFFKNSVLISGKNIDNLVDVLDNLKQGIGIENGIIISISVEQKFINSKAPPMILSEFKPETTQIYYQSSRNILHKFPMEHYLNNFGGYPHLSSDLTYLK